MLNSIDFVTYSISISENDVKRIDTRRFRLEETEPRKTKQERRSTKRILKPKGATKSL